MSNNVAESNTKTASNVRPSDGGGVMRRKDIAFARVSLFCDDFPLFAGSIKTTGFYQLSLAGYLELDWWITNGRDWRWRPF